MLRYSGRTLIISISWFYIFLAFRNTRAQKKPNRWNSLYLFTFFLKKVLEKGRGSGYALPMIISEYEHMIQQNFQS